MSWDPRAERIAARAEATKAEAEAAVLRMQAETARQDADAARKGEERRARRQAAAERRQALGRTARSHVDKLIPAAAIGAPAIIAWNGQYKFAAEVMHLGLLSPLLPVAIEGGVLYCASLAHQAIKAELPAGRYRAMTWGLAAVASGMNFWHGVTATGGKVSAADYQVGTALGLTSLLGIAFLELTVALKKKATAGRSAAEIRRALVRRLRYPRLSIQAASIAAARGLETEEAWRAAWVDRYGIGPDSTRGERTAAQYVMKSQERADKAAAKAGDLTIADGAIVRAPAPVAGPMDDGLTAKDLASLQEAAEGVEEIEQWLNGGVSAQGTTLERPPVSAHDGDAVSGDERSPAPADERPVSAHDDGAVSGSERSNERKKPRRRALKVSARKGARGGKDERLAAVRKLLTKNPDMSGADISRELKIPSPTARRLRAEVLREQGKGGES